MRKQTRTLLSEEVKTDNESKERGSRYWMSSPKNRAKALQSVKMAPQGVIQPIHQG